VAEGVSTGSTGGEFRKAGAAAPDGYFAWEAAGLRWLADAAGARVVAVRDVSDGQLVLERLSPGVPTAGAARSFGRGLAATHDAGAAAWGCGPEGWEGDGFFGPLSQPLPMPLGRWGTWGTFYAEARLAPMVRRCRDAGVYDARAVAVLDRLAERVSEGAYDTDDRPARIHGDLWSGNLMWTSAGVTLIDPAAHGGHRETDLALLALFGTPHLGALLEGYQEAHPLAEGWRERVGLHQLHCLLVHAEIFGGGFGGQALAVARAV
jgi:fructosamine-3-kinase